MKGTEYRLRIQEPGAAYYLTFSNSVVKINGEWLEVYNAANETLTAVFHRHVVTYCMIPSAIERR